MSDGLSDGNAVNKLATDVENRAWDLVAALYRARSGHRGLTPGDGVELANEKLRLFSLRLVKETDYAEKIDKHGHFTQRSGSFHEERGRREMKCEVAALLRSSGLDDAVREALIKQLDALPDAPRGDR